MANIKFLSNVTHNGVLFKTGDVVDGIGLDVAQGLFKRGLAEETADAPTHSSIEGDTSNRALPLDPSVTSTDPTQAEIDAENARREVELQKQQAAQTAAAQQQVAQSQPDAPANQPTPSEVAATVAGIQ
jgi:hypothetical protein